MLSRRIRYSCVYTARMSPTLSGSSALQRVKLSDALKIRNGIIFDFYSGLPHIGSGAACTERMKASPAEDDSLHSLIT